MRYVSMPKRSFNSKLVSVQTEASNASLHMPTQIQIQMPRSMERSAISRIMPEGKCPPVMQKNVVSQMRVACPISHDTGIRPFRPTEIHQRGMLACHMEVAKKILGNEEWSQGSIVISSFRGVALLPQSVTQGGLSGMG
eukprot:1143485-Pelagomonas_calceolata.AAC.3